MEDLRKLVQIVTNRGQKNFPLLELKGTTTSKEADLFLKIKKGICKTDQEAATVMYKTVPEDPRMKMLKSRLRKKLFNHLFFLDFSDNSLKKSNRFELECQTLMYQALVLILEGERVISNKILHNVLKLAIEGEFTSIIINSQELLLSNYALANNFNKFYKTRKELKPYRKLLQLEDEAQDLYLVALLELNKSVKAKNNYLPKLKNTVLRLEELWKETKSINIFNNYYFLISLKQQMEGDFDKILDLTNASEKMLQQGKINKKRFDDRYNKFMNVYAYLRVKDYPKGLASAENYLPAFNRSTNNWFAFMENYFLLAMHAGNYDLASKLYTESLRNAFFRKISKTAQERWTLYGTYLYFVNPSDQLLKQSNYRKLINAVPEYSKDKLGFNVAILVLQCLYYVQAQDIEALLYRIENLKKYAGRHLTHQLSKRNLYFFKLLTLLVKEDLDYSQASKKGEVLLEKLIATPVPGDAYAEIEIIPYEQLWKLLLQIVKKFD